MECECLLGVSVSKLDERGFFRKHSSVKISTSSWRIVIAHRPEIPLHFSEYNARISRNEDPENSIEKLMHKNFYIAQDNFYKRKYDLSHIEEIFMRVFAENVANIDFV